MTAVAAAFGFSKRARRSEIQYHRKKTVQNATDCRSDNVFHDCRLPINRSSSSQLQCWQCRAGFNFLHLHRSLRFALAAFASFFLSSSSCFNLAGRAARLSLSRRSAAHAFESWDFRKISLVVFV